MSAAKHTPAPWTATVGGRYVTAPETEDHLELRVQINGGNPQVNKANARLIAAAPDLLAALQKLVAEVDEMAARVGWAGYGGRVDARLAIAEATGAAK